MSFFKGPRGRAKTNSIPDHGGFRPQYVPTVTQNFNHTYEVPRLTNVDLPAGSSRDFYQMYSGRASSQMVQTVTTSGGSSMVHNILVLGKVQP